MSEFNKCLEILYKCFKNKNNSLTVLDETQFLEFVEALDAYFSGGEIRRNIKQNMNPDSVECLKYDLFDNNPFQLSKYEIDIEKQEIIFHFEPGHEIIIKEWEELIANQERYNIKYNRIVEYDKSYQRTIEESCIEFKYKNPSKEEYEERLRYEAEKLRKAEEKNLKVEVEQEKHKREIKSAEENKEPGFFTKWFGKLCCRSRKNLSIAQEEMPINKELQLLESEFKDEEKSSHWTKREAFKRNLPTLNIASSSAKEGQPFAVVNLSNIDRNWAEKERSKINSRSSALSRKNDRIGESLAEAGLA